MFNPEWTTTTTASYVTATGGSGDTDLNMFHPTGVFLRSVDGGGYEVEVRAYGRNVEIEVTPIRYDAGGPNTGANVPAAFTLSTSTGDSEWFSGTSSLTANNISLEGSSANDPAVFGFAIAAKKVGANDARIYMIDVAEKRADSGDIPTSEEREDGDGRARPR